ncbi:hypothetical protein GEI7407_3701 [Geitlerinema sp. PCC 7407]|nr:hypothetical protein GEI7407_3701 [Geitlerinema sp. PCC 7407]
MAKFPDKLVGKQCQRPFWRQSGLQCRLTDVQET